MLGVFSPGADGSAATVGAMAEPPALVFDDDTDVAAAMEMLRDFIGDAVPVVARADGRFLGAVSESAVFAAWADQSRRLREEENASL